MSIFSTIASSVGSRVGMFAIGYGIGSAVGIAIAKTVIERKLIAEYEERLQQEIKETKRFYKALKKRPVKDISGAVEKEKKNDYRKLTTEYNKPLLIEEVEEIVVDDNPYPKSYEEREERLRMKYEREEPFTKEDTTLSWSVEITEEEFFQNDSEFEQTTWTYFSEDDVMTDERNEPVTNWQDVVDKRLIELLDSSGHDTNVIYIRDKYKELEYEITLDAGSYTSTLGIEDHLEHEYEARRGPKVKKFRSEDE